MSDILRIGCGAGFSADRLDPAIDLIDRGELDVIVFECIGERTLAFGHRDRRADPESGYNPMLPRRMRAVLPRAAARATRVITNMGVANPAAAATQTLAIARELGLHGLRIAAVTGDDVGACVTPETVLWEGMSVAATGAPVIGANAYLGADALLPALDADADVIITGRVSDPALFIAPLRHRFGWGPDDWDELAGGTATGHLLECAAQVTGGYFADPGYKDVNDLAYVGFPLAEVRADGSACITKLAGSGGVVDERTVKEQLLYEIHDPARYVTPDVIADFSDVLVAAQGPDRVRVSGARGDARPDTLKVTVSCDGGFLAEAGISYAGAGAGDRARLAGRIVAERVRTVHGIGVAPRIDLIGVSSLHASARQYASTELDVRLRCALRTDSMNEAEALLWEVESLLCCGPAAGGGYRGRITPQVVTYSASLSRARVKPRIEMFTA